MKCSWRLPYGAFDFLLQKGVELEVQECTLVPHTHPVSAVIRNWFELKIIRQYRDCRIKSVGGNDVRHARQHSFAQIHSCCPTLDGSDEIRNAKRIGRARGNYCTLRFQDCDVPAEVFLFSHSMYYYREKSYLAYQLELLSLRSIMYTRDRDRTHSEKLL